jgi:hypothetical protein
VGGEPACGTPLDGSKAAPVGGRYGGSVIVDGAVYRNGRRVAEPDNFAELHAACSAGDAIAWLGLYEPSEEEFAAVALAFDLMNSRSRTRSRPINVRSWSATAKRCSSSFRPRAMSTRRKPSRSARSQSLSAAIRHHCAPRRRTAATARAQAARIAPRPAPSWSDRGCIRDRRPRRRWLRAGSGGCAANQAA